MEFQSSQQKLQRGPCCYYSYESRGLQIAPWSFVSFNTGSLAGSEGEAGFHRPFPGEGLTGGEGGGVEKEEEVQEHL